MTTIVPTKYTVLTGLDNAIARGRDVRATQVARLAENAHWAASNGALRMAANVRNATTTSSSFTTLYEVYLTHAVEREIRGLRFSYSVTNCDLSFQVLEQPLALIGTTDFVIGTATGNNVVTYTSTTTIVRIRIRARTNTGSGTATIGTLGVWEYEHAAATLPG